MTPYGGTFLNNQYGYGGGYGSPYGGYGGYGQCTGYYDYYSTGCGPLAPIGGYPPYGGIGGIPPYGGIGGGLPYQQTVIVVAPPGGIVILSWIAAPNIQSYRIYQASATSPLNFTVVQTVNQATGILATNATVTGLVPGQTYYFQVRGVDPAGLESVVPAYSNSSGYGGIPGVPGYPGFPGYPGYPGIPGFPGVPGALPAPTAVTVVGVTGTTATITWTAVPGATSYRILQSLTTIGAYVPSNPATSAGTQVTVLGLTPSTSYVFQVVAVDAFGSQSPPGTSAPATTTAGP
jgi:hypothetical protein